MMLCPPCHEKWLRWLDYRIRPRWIVNVGGGDNGLARNIEARKAAADDAAALIRRQQAGIVADCTRGHGVAA